MAPRRPTSNVWNYMEKIHPDMVACRLCKREMKYSHRSTTNFRRHIMKKHDIPIDDVEFDPLPSSFPEPSGDRPTITKSKIAKPLSRRGRKSSSSVWSFFTKIGEETVKCSVCKGEFAHTHGSTSNLRKHLLGKHGMKEDDLRESQSDIQDNLQNSDSLATSSYSHNGSSGASTDAKIPIHPSKSSGNYKTDSTRKHRLDSLVLQVVTSGLQPFSIIEEHGFVRLIGELDWRYQLPSKKQLSSNMLPSIYNRQAKLIKLALQQAEEVSLTVDEWTSENSVNLTVSAHCISKDWEYLSFVLNTVQLSANHDADLIAGELAGVLAKWEITDKVKTLVADNSNNMLAVVRRLGVQHVPCFAHSLNFIVTESLRNSVQILAVIQRVSATVNHFESCTEASDMLKTVQAQSNIESESKKLIQHMPMRWTSTLAMLTRYLELHDVVNQALYLTLKTQFCITEEEVSIIKKTIEALGPFEEAITQMSMEALTPLAKIIPINKGLSECLCDSMEQNFSLVAELQHQMNLQLGRLEQTLTFGVSTLIDPRFKCLTFTNGSTTQWIEEQISDLLKSDVAAVCKEEKDTTSTMGAPDAKRSRLWEKFTSQVKALSTTTLDCESGPSMELTQFYRTQILKLEDDPLVWWKDNARLFPMLSKIAKRFLAIPATSVPPKRLFWKEGELFSERRASVKPKHLDMMLFLKSNWRV